MIADLALIRVFQQVDAAQQRTLARAGRADDADHFTLARGEVDAPEHLVAAERLMQIADLNHLLCHCLSTSSSFSLLITISERLSLWEPQMT